MAAGTADLSAAIVAAWNASGLDAAFKALWDGEHEDEFYVLHEQEAPGGQPWPYCVLDQMTPSVSARMSSVTGGIREERNVPVRFNVHARDLESDSRTCQEIAAYLAEEIMKVFGGHPTVSATGSIELSNGNHVLTQYQNDFGANTGDDEFQWAVSYLIKVDVPVAA